MKKIGVYTIIADNFGAQLQAYATAKYLTSVCKGCSVELVKIKEENKEKKWKRIIKSFIPSYIKKKNSYKDFERLLPLTHESYTGSELIETPLVYDLYIVGSDQVWNVSGGIEDHLIYFLPFQTHSPKIALASSFGAASIHEDLKKDIRNYLLEFTSISVREADGVSILTNMGIFAQQILDPTFWLEQNQWENLAGDKPLVEGEYIATYGFETSNNNVQNLIDIVKRIYRVPVVAINGARIFKFDKYYNTCGPKEILNIIKYSKLVLTGSFHGTAFSIIFGKNFFVMPHSSRNSRMENLLSVLNISERMLPSDKSVYECYIKNASPIDYTSLEVIISKNRIQTQTYILNVLKNIMQ